MPNVIIPWGKIDNNELPLFLTLSQCHSIEIRKQDNEILITEDNNRSVSHYRFITGDDHNIFLEPGLPNLPIILKPVHNISILPSKKLDIFVEVPSVLKILYGSQNKKTTLSEFNLKCLSKSYFGNSENGEFAYFLESPFFRHISEYDNIDSSIYCPLVISNKSLQNLEFERMILRAPYLSIYNNQNVLIASPVNITFRGQEQISQIVYKKGAPVSGGEIKLVSAPRMEADKNLLKRSFYFIKNLYAG